MVPVSIESKGVAGCSVVLVDYEGDSAAPAEGGRPTALANEYNSISINKVKGIVRRKQRDRCWAAGCVD